ncbi:hypothetical protein C6P40_003593 [Pichia californica]|uniref:Mitochondrial import protein 1 n=1 Tax=Pichia californica TaxID=460514 RepID=A0A9P6WQ46_9ASCO|nr:hypothetical protein C6P40_003593 [[Candida] californica]
MDNTDIDAVHGGVEALEDVKAALDQQHLSNVIQKSETTTDNEHYDETDEDNDVIATAAVESVEPVEPVYDIDFGRIGNFVVKCGINLVLPFINGMMMGFGEIFAHELCFRHHWRYARVSPPERMYRIQMNSNANKAVQERSSVLSYT